MTDGVGVQVPALEHVDLSPDSLPLEKLWHLRCHWCPCLGDRGAGPALGSGRGSAVRPVPTPTGISSPQAAWGQNSSKTLENYQIWFFLSQYITVTV